MIGKLVKPYHFESRYFRDMTLFPLGICIFIGLLVGFDWPPTWRTALILCLLSLQTWYVVEVYCWKQIARLWFLAGMMGFLNCGIFFLIGAKLETLQFIPIAWLVGTVSIIVGVSFLWSLAYTASIWPDLVKRDLAIGRFNLERGFFDPATISLDFPYKSIFMRKTAPIVALLLPTFSILGAVIGVELTRPNRLSLSLWGSAFNLIGVCSCSYVVAFTFYTYLWIRRWEKQTGRTMWIKGFEPTVREEGGK